jgi:hypothetical protein
MTADGTERKEFAVGTSGGITSGFVGIRDGDGLVRLGGSLLSLSKGTVGPDVRPPRPSGTVRYLSVFAFCLMDYGSRNLVRQRFGANRKKIAMTAAIRAQGRPPGSRERGRNRGLGPIRAPDGSVHGLLASWPAVLLCVQEVLTGRSLG